MAVELAEVAAGLPMAASLALAGGITTLREGRRRAVLNESMHELRRPLQVLSLALPADSPEAVPVESSLDLARVALDRLDRQINGASLEEVVTDVPVRGLVEEAAQRWRNAAVLGGGSLQVKWNGHATVVEGDRFELAQALDNLLSNAIEHGGGRVRIECHREDGWVCISVSDAGDSGRARNDGPRFGRGGRRRRGHGLRVIGRVARRHGGSFTLQRSERGAEASLRLPLRRRVDQR
jgi:two-component system sensor histidine kinase MtrB